MQQLFEKWRGRLFAGALLLVLLGGSASQAFAGKAGDARLLDRSSSRFPQVPSRAWQPLDLSPLSTVEQDGVAYTSLYVPFVHQVFDTDATFDGNCACGPTSLDMVLAYFGRIDARPTALATPFPHNSQYGWAVTDSGYSYAGSTFDRAIVDCAGGPDRYGGLYGALMVSDWEQQTQWQRLMDTAAAHGLAVTEHRGGDMNFDVLKAAINQGHPVILGTNGLTGFGHLLVATGYTSDGRVITNDPYGAKGEGYPNYSGFNAVYRWEDFGTMPNSWEISGAPEGWTAEYYDGQGGVHVRWDRELNFDWGEQGPEWPLGGDTFTARWTRDIPLEGGIWTAQLITDGDARVRIGGNVVVEQLDPGPGVREYTFAVAFKGGTQHVEVEYRHNPGDPSVIKFRLARP